MSQPRESVFLGKGKLNTQQITNTSSWKSSNPTTGFPCLWGLLSLGLPKEDSWKPGERRRRCNSLVQPGAFAQWLPFTPKRSTKATCPYTHPSHTHPSPHPPCCPGAAGRSRCTQCWLQRGARGETLKLSLGKEHHRGHCHETKASWEHQPCATAGSTRSHPAPSKAQGFPQFQDCHLPWDNQRSQRGAGGVQGHLEAGSPPAQVSSITTEPSRTHQPRELLAQISQGWCSTSSPLDILSPGCRYKLWTCCPPAKQTPRARSKQLGTSGTALGRLNRACRGVFLGF